MKTAAQSRIAQTLFVALGALLRRGARVLRGESSRVMPTERIDVRGVARLARLALTDDEVERYGAQLESLLQHVDDLKALDTSDVAATAQVIESRNVMRPDVLAPCLDHDAVMAGAPQAQHGFFRVPKIIAEAG
jgi:aspartyl-tRNA(Asn)/glutamyl-tRNA(Gln) amidotransferase subunit C